MSGSDKIVATYNKEDGLEIFEQEKNECPSGGTHIFKHSKRGGDVACIKCGLVIVDHTIGQLGKGTRKGEGGTRPSYLKR